MKNHFLIFLVLISPILLMAQPAPCTDPPTMTSVCIEACIICDIDGFRGRHESEIIGEAPPGFAGDCTLAAHNMQWIAFIAGSVNLEVRMSVSNCVSNLGLEFGLYKGIDCDNFQRISNCFGGAGRNTISAGESGIIKNTEPLVIGQYYYIVMDGGLGDNCDWTFEVVEGDTRVAPLDTSGEIIGNFDTCPNIEQQFQVEPPVGATEFRWVLNNRDLNNNAPILPLTFDQAGLFTLCVTSFNACDAAPPTCQQVLITAPPSTFLEEIICEGDNFEVADTILNTTGNYEFHVLTNKGCDSTINVSLEAIPASFTDLGRINICEGDTLPIADEFFFTAGVHEKILPNFVGCDSTISIDLFVVICNIQGTIISTPVACFGEATGSFNFSVNNGTPPFNYQWESLGGGNSGNGTIETLDATTLVDNLSVGTYLVTIDDGFGNQRILIEEILQPNKLDLSWNTSDYNDFQISCFGEEDGAIAILPEGGMAPYAYQWEDRVLTPQRIALSAGDYRVTISDANNCEVATNIPLRQPSELRVIADFIHPNCEGLATGRVVVNEIDGGVAPYFFGLNNGQVGPDAEFIGLTEGAYTITAADANGCEYEQEGRLTAPSIPTLELGEDLIIGLADNIMLSPEIARDVSTTIWRPDTSLSCQDCLEPIVHPANRTTYHLTVSSVDECTATDSITIQVLKIRDVYVANVFSPNQDGVNDKLVVHAGPEADNINSFQVFTRWGELVYSTQNFLPNDQESGWNGTNNGQTLDSGVYIWMAEIHFIDGEKIVYSGDVALIR